MEPGGKKEKGSTLVGGEEDSKEMRKEARSEEKSAEMERSPWGRWSSERESETAAPELSEDGRERRQKERQ